MRSARRIPRRSNDDKSPAIWRSPISLAIRASSSGPSRCRAATIWIRSARHASSVVEVRKDAHPLDGETVLVKQTIQREAGGDYVIDEHREKHCDRGDPYAVGRAVLDALAGQLSS